MVNYPVEINKYYSLLDSISHLIALVVQIAVNNVFANVVVKKKKVAVRDVVRVLHAHFVVLVNMYVMTLSNFDWIIKETIIFFITKHLFMKRDVIAAVQNAMFVEDVLVKSVPVVVVNAVVLICVVIPVPQIF